MASSDGPSPAAPRISLDQWRALVAVVESGSYARAAQALHRTQSTVTYALQQLAAQLGVSPFRIEGRRARLTATGALLYRRARYLIEEAASLERAAGRISAGWEAEIRIAAEVVFPSWLLLRCLQRFGEESPGTHVEVTESVLGHRTLALARGEADLAIYTGVPSGFLGEPLMHLRFVLAAHPDHPLHRLGRELTQRDFRSHRHLVVRETSPERAAEPSMRTTRRWTVSQMSTSIEAVRAGYGFAWLPEEQIRPEIAAGTLKPLPLREGAQRFVELYLLFADAENAGPGATRLAQIIREAVRSECEGRGLADPAAQRPAARKRRR